jgi:methionyl-tRNA formyltransferase
VGDPLRRRGDRLHVPTPKLAETVGALLPTVLARVASGDPGDPQDESQASYLGPFEPEYVQIDWSSPAVEIERQVRAWRFHAAIPRGGALAAIDGELVRVLRVTREPGKGPAMECADGTLWIVETEAP